MPTDLVDHIKSLKPKDRQQVWVSCKGLSDSDDIGPVEYSNSRGFPSFYYPYTNQPGYLSPLVAVHFARPPGKNRLPTTNKELWIAVLCETKTISNKFQYRTLKYNFTENHSNNKKCCNCRRTVSLLFVYIMLFLYFFLQLKPPSTSSAAPGPRMSCTVADTAIGEGRYTLCCWSSRFKPFLWERGWWKCS